MKLIKAHSIGDIIAGDRHFEVMTSLNGDFGLICHSRIYDKGFFELHPFGEVSCEAISITDFLMSIVDEPNRNLILAELREMLVARHEEDSLTHQ